MENKKKYVSFTAVISITLTAIISGFALSFLNAALAEDIEANQIKATMEAISVVLPEAKEIVGPTPIGEEDLYYKGLDSEGEVVGYALRTSAIGYAGDVNVLVGYDKTLEYIKGIVPLEHAETPNIGTKISEDEFKNQFNDVASFVEYVLVKGESDINSGQISAITGATVSSGAIVAAVNKAGDYIINNNIK